ncbi:MAG TPA: transporter [Candidatus Limnocylindria bacterium]|nr:transporter [Candidatus Limnocylindria bacterium]
MSKRLVLLCLTLTALRFPDQLYAQFTDPRTYDNTPVGVNQVELAYAHVRSNASIDTAIIVAGAEFNLNQGTIQYTRDFSFVRRLAWVQVSVPLASLEGSVTGSNIRASATGTGDSSYELAVLLKGGPALSVKQFATHKPTTTIGTSLTITAPTGLYHPDKLLNLGSNRWSFKPEIAVSYPFGPKQKWELDAYANAYFYTDNNSYHGVEILRQQPLPGLEGHISYSLTSNLWVSLDTRYSFRGDTFVNGINQNNVQENFTLGSEVNVSLNAQNSLVFEFAKALVHQNGPAATGFAVKYLCSWGKGYR